MALIDVSSIIQLAYFGSFIVLMFYGQRIQISMMLVGVKRNLGKLERLRKAAHDSVLSSALRFKGDQKAVESRIDRLTGSFAIQPVSMDPSGIVGKLEHILDTYDDNLRTEVKAIAASATEAEVNTLSNQMEISIGADQMYRVVRHFYLLARKQGGILALYQLQMAMPQIMEEAEAYSSAIDAFAKGNPIGDGIGPLIASKMAEGAQPQEIEQGSNLRHDPTSKAGGRRSNSKSQEHNSVRVKVGRYGNCCRHRQHYGNTVARPRTSLLFGHNQSTTSYIVL